MLPKQFGNWTQEAGSIAQVPADIEESTETSAARPVYDQVVMRTYRNIASGASIMLVVAYGRQQKQEFKIHRPNLCYYGQGFYVTDEKSSRLLLNGSTAVSAESFLAINRGRQEFVTYWIRIGHRISNDPWATRWFLLREALAGRVPDGMLVRASSLVNRVGEIQQSSQSQRMFLSDLYAALPPTGRHMLAGSQGDLM